MIIHALAWRCPPSQLTYMSTEGEWDVKNLRKWSDVNPMGEPITGFFRSSFLGHIEDAHCERRL
jgi:hypothetical protein